MLAPGVCNFIIIHRFYLWQSLLKGSEDTWAPVPTVPGAGDRAGGVVADGYSSEVWGG